VLGGDARNRILWAIECKDLSGALSAADVAREMGEHFRVVGGTSMSKHAERVAWLESRLPAALARLGLGDDSAGWTVRGLFVTGRPVVAPYIDDLPFDVVPVDQLTAHLRSAKAD
jgi:hypothetical protein